MGKFEDSPGFDTWFARIIRDTDLATVTIPNGVHTSDAIDIRRHTMFTLRLPAVWTAASIGFKAAENGAGPYYILYEDDGTLMQVAGPVALRAYVLPDKIAAAHFIKLWSQNGAGANVNQAAARDIAVTLKG
jgi:hypothetical protein